MTLSHPGITRFTHGEASKVFKYKLRTSLNSDSIEIPLKYCTVKNCHNCARSINYGFGNRDSRVACTSMYHQKGCCDFYIKRSKGMVAWSPSLGLNRMTEWSAK